MENKRLTKEDAAYIDKILAIQANQIFDDMAVTLNELRNKWAKPLFEAI